MNEWFKKVGPGLFAAVAGVVAVLPAIILGVPNNNDLANHYHFAIPFYEALRQGEVYPGWLATPNFGFGDVVVRFYPPALYYLLAAGRALAGNWYVATLIVMAALSALGSLGAYFWARCFVPRKVAVWAGVFYAFMPYHLSEFYQAAQLAEFAGGAALLFAFAFAWRLCNEGRWRDVAGLAAAYAALILSHLPLAVFGSLALLVYTVMNMRKRAAGVSFLKLSAGVLAGLAASSFYWARMVSELKWIIADGANPDPLLDYRHNFVFSTFSPEKQETLWWMALLAITTLMMCAPAFVILRKRFEPASRRSLIAVATLLIFSIFMSTALSKPVWAVVPYLRLTQHPFRWLAVTSAIAPILMAASVPFWSKQLQQRQRSLALVMTGLVLIAVTFSLSQTVRGATYLSRPTFERMLAPLKESPSIVQWLPIWASASAHNKPSYEKCLPPAPTAEKIEAPNRQLRVIEWSDLKRVFEVEAGPAAEARVATFYYPHWVAEADGHALSVRPAPDGTLLIALPPQKIVVNLEFREPGRSKLSATISIISWTLIGSLLIFGSFSRKRRDYEQIRRDATKQS
jgi:6-pyruvoyl-tetrahydropterin synthase related domain